MSQVKVVEELIKICKEALFVASSSITKILRTPYQRGIFEFHHEVSLPSRTRSASTYSYLSRSGGLKKSELHIDFDLAGLPSPTISKAFLDRLPKHLRFKSILKHVALPRLAIEPPSAAVGSADR
ncbi:hypothetical protein J3458_019391 [Metarhizium acridum]|uniref:uncharacterized protein n=1 Tax=Metarhizium acridum TaxID=92637 RepID=UPI001C6CAD37|nr:hypothetical protein J3458_019391 [Metarhizium acridum]